MAIRFIILFLIFSSTIRAQNVSFTASTDANEVLEGNYFQVTFKLNNARGTGFSAPSFRDFKVLSGPSTSSQMTIVNGRTSQSMAYSYTLMPTGAGTFTIGPASINAGGKTLKTNPVKVKVLKGDEKPVAAGSKNQGEDVFVEIELSDSVAYVGQQVTLKYVIYTSVDVRSYNFINESEYNGFYVEDLQNYKDQAIRVVRNGQQFVRQTLKAVSLFPQQTGAAEIGSSIINLGIAIKSDRPSFFFSTSMRSKRVTTEPVTINILPSPDDAPNSFSGGIGNFKMNSRIDKNNISLDGAITMTMTIEGDGDARFVSPPDQNFVNFDVYEPNLLTENKRIVNGRIIFNRTYEYLLVPKEKGASQIQPEFSYYNIDSARYETIKGPVFSVRVAGGQRNQIISTEDLDTRLAPIYTTTSWRKASWYTPVFSPLHIGFLSACSLAFMTLFGIRWKTIQQSKIDPTVLKSKKAQKVATDKLAVSKEYLEGGDVKEFYSSMLDALINYLSDKLHVPAAQISKEGVSALFADHQIAPELTDRIKDLMNTCEMAVYAGFTPERATEDYEMGKELITDIEDDLKK